MPGHTSNDGLLRHLPRRAVVRGYAVSTGAGSTCAAQSWRRRSTEGVDREEQDRLGRWRA
ncbi:hypothetical protein [Micromonospora echinofusca]|uniref:Uncharacterized protein n=1 Tax=Micromonospora echinofusca TaxID=47858 RepID=A0ABS3VYI6_MICEH|nr:hypothetical protein [Micromonospora echinofusca]MBO4209503.1 hypothetical protein [Micromonospora echinofusca]